MVKISDIITPNLPILHKRQYFRRWQCHNAAETAPGRGGFVLVDRAGLDMKRGRDDGGAIIESKHCAFCLGDFLSIAIDICQVDAIFESIPANACNTLAYR